MPEIDPRFRREFQEVMEHNDVWDPRGLMELPEGAEDSYEDLPLYASLPQVAFLDGLPVAEQNRVMIRAAAAHLRTVLDHAAKYFAGRDSDYFCVVTIDFWDEFDNGGLITPRFLYANPAREFLQNVFLLPTRSRYSEFTADCLDQSADYVLHDQPDVLVARRGLPESGDFPIESVWVQHVSCQVPPAIVLPDPRP